MKPIKSMFNEVRFELLKILLLNIFLETAVVFLFSFLIVSVFSGKVWYSLIIAVIYFGIQIYRKSKHLSLKTIEQNNPEIKEMLRTAADNQDQDSLMAHALFQEVIDKMRNVSSGTFLDMSIVLKRITALFLLSIIIVSLAFFNINIAQFEDPLARPLNAASRFIKGFTGGELPAENIDLGDDALYGDARMAELGNDQLQLEINPSLNQIDFSNVEDPDVSGETIEDYPGEAEAVKSSSGVGSVSSDIMDRKTASEYSQQIK